MILFNQCRARNLLRRVNFKNTEKISLEARMRPREPRYLKYYSKIRRRVLRRVNFEEKANN